MLAKTGEPDGPKIFVTYLPIGCLVSNESSDLCQLFSWHKSEEAQGTVQGREKGERISACVAATKILPLLPLNHLLPSQTLQSKLPDCFSRVPVSHCCTHMRPLAFALVPPLHTTVAWFWWHGILGFTAADCKINPWIRLGCNSHPSVFYS